HPPAAKPSRNPPTLLYSRRLKNPLGTQQKNAAPTFANSRPRASISLSAHAQSIFRPRTETIPSLAARWEFPASPIACKAIACLRAEFAKKQQRRQGDARRLKTVGRFLHPYRIGHNERAAPPADSGTSELSRPHS